jgi:hypothetical protein
MSMSTILGDVLAGIAGLFSPSSVGPYLHLQTPANFPGGLQEMGRMNAGMAQQGMQASGVIARRTIVAVGIPYAATIAALAAPTLGGLGARVSLNVAARYPPATELALDLGNALTGTTLPRLALGTGSAVIGGAAGQTVLSEAELNLGGTAQTLEALGAELEQSLPLRSAPQAAVRAFETGLADVGAGRYGFSSYNVASKVSKAVGFAGADMEHAHILPQAIGKYIPGYSPGRALGTYLPRVAHRAWDAPWIQEWNAAVRDKTPMTAGQVFTMLDNALSTNKYLTAEARGNISARPFQEMFSELELLWDTPILP